MKEFLVAMIVMQITVFAGKHDRVNMPARVSMTLPKSVAEVRSVVLKAPDGTEVLGQLTKPGVLSVGGAVPEGQVRRELHFVVAKLKAGEEMTLEATIKPGDRGTAEGFKWRDTAGEFSELRFGERPVLRYMYKAIDESSPQARELTYKVFHHVFDPSGRRLVTKGAGGKYTHHRGLFYGFNKTTYGEGKRVDIWHCTGDTHQSHEGFVAIEKGPVVGRHCVAVDWHGVGKEVFAKEQREMTVYNVPGGVLIEFASVLRSADGKIKLDGDPQHAGFHFRADDEVASKTEGQTYFLRPDGKGGPGETRNWPGNKNHVNLPWDAMSFVLGDKRYTAVYLDKPTNPKEARFSERAYGRFGSYFEYELDGADELKVNYRIWLQDGEMTGEEVSAKSADFVEPARVTAAVGFRAR